VWTITWQHISPEVIVKGFRGAVYPMECMGLMICCGMAVKRIGMLRVSVRKMKTLNVKMETDTLIDKDR
jgi:hypothetical protein